MEEKKPIKISLSTLFLIIAVIVIAIMGYFIYRLSAEKNVATEQVSKLNNTVDILQGKRNDIYNTINSNNSVENVTNTSTSSDEQTSSNDVEKILNVGNHTLKLGTYKLDNINNSEYYGTLILKPNGVFHIKSNCDAENLNSVLDSDGKYTVEKAAYPGGGYGYGLNFITNTGTEFFYEVSVDNVLSSQWNGYSYAGN